MASKIKTKDIKHSMTADQHSKTQVVLIVAERHGARVLEGHVFQSRAESKFVVRSFSLSVWMMQLMRRQPSQCGKLLPCRQENHAQQNALLQSPSERVLPCLVPPVPARSTRHTCNPRRLTHGAVSELRSTAPAHLASVTNPGPQNGGSRANVCLLSGAFSYVSFPSLGQRLNM